MPSDSTMLLFEFERSSAVSVDCDDASTKDAASVRQEVQASQHVILRSMGPTWHQ